MVCVAVCAVVCAVACVVTCPQSPACRAFRCVIVCVVVRAAACAVACVVAGSGVGRPSGMPGSWPGRASGGVPWPGRGDRHGSGARVGRRAGSPWPGRGVGRPSWGGWRAVAACWPGAGGLAGPSTERLDGRGRDRATRDARAQGPGLYAPVHFPRVLRSRPELSGCPPVLKSVNCFAVSFFFYIWRGFSVFLHVYG